MNILSKEIALAQHNFAKFPTERSGSSTMLTTSGWLGMQLCYPQAHSLICWLTKQAFLLSNKFPFSSTVYNCEAVQCITTKSTILVKLSGYAPG